MVKNYKENSDILVLRKDLTYRIVRVMKDENSEGYCFVNLSTGHVCKCRFNSIEDAFKDLDLNENVESWAYMSEFNDNLNASAERVNVLEDKIPMTHKFTIYKDKHIKSEVSFDNDSFYQKNANFFQLLAESHSRDEVCDLYVRNVNFMNISDDCYIFENVVHFIVQEIDSFCIMRFDIFRALPPFITSKHFDSYEKCHEEFIREKESFFPFFDTENNDLISYKLKPKYLRIGKHFSVCDGLINLFF